MKAIGIHMLTSVHLTGKVILVSSYDATIDSGPLRWLEMMVVTDKQQQGDGTGGARALRNG